MESIYNQLKMMECSKIFDLSFEEIQDEYIYIPITFDRESLDKLSRIVKEGHADNIVLNGITNQQGFALIQNYKHYKNDYAVKISYSYDRSAQKNVLIYINNVAFECINDNNAINIYVKKCDFVSVGFVNKELDLFAY